METLKNIHEKVTSYVDGSIDYAAFRLWMADAYAGCNLTDQSEPLQLCRAIEWECADFSEGMISEMTLRQNLSALCSAQDTVVYCAEPITVPQNVLQPSVLTGTSATILSPAETVGRSVGVLRVAEYA